MNMYDGKYLSCLWIKEGLANVVIDCKDASVNTIGQGLVSDLEEVVKFLQQAAEEGQLKGYIISSAKKDFLVGADVKEFIPMFAMDEQTIIGFVDRIHRLVNALEDLPVPSVSLIDGYALGGGLELAQVTAYRVVTPRARLGQPEVKLGIIPGFGGTVRLPRIIGLDLALEYIAGGQEIDAQKACQIGLASAEVSPDKLMLAAEKLIEQSMKSDLWQAEQERKRQPVQLNQTEQLMAFSTSEALIRQRAGKHYPAPILALKSMQKSAIEGRDKAVSIEAQYFYQSSQLEQTKHLIGLFFSDQFVKKKNSTFSGSSAEIKSLGIVGAGIMGSGVAYQSALKGMQVIIRDTSDEALTRSRTVIDGYIDGRIKRKRLDAKGALGIANSIQGVRGLNEFSRCDAVIEAIYEDEETKKKLLADIEAQVSDDCLIGSNTSTIPISELMEALKNPERFCGIHFFNPVPKMLLVEIIRTPKVSSEVLARAVGLALKMGKVPLVVGDGPGFLVNRLLAPYMKVFQILVFEGFNFEQIDKIMENFGWPMGPARLCDEVGIDIVSNVSNIMTQKLWKTEIKGDLSINRLIKNNKLGRKTGQGFYEYDDKGKAKSSQESHAYVYGTDASREADPEEVINRMMIPMIFEAARCLEHSIVETPTELDIGMVYGTGFPPFRGGLLRYADDLGYDKIMGLTEEWADQAMYQAPDFYLQQAKKGFYRN